jgi:hypothetical protein
MRQFVGEAYHGQIFYIDAYLRRDETYDSPVELDTAIEVSTEDVLFNGQMSVAKSYLSPSLRRSSASSFAGFKWRLRPLTMSKPLHKFPFREVSPR